MQRRTLLLAALFAPAIAPVARAAGRPKVVATFSVLGDMVRQIAGDKVALVTIVGPDGDSEAYEPTAADGRAVAEADLLVMNGLNKEFEPWLPGLLQQAEFHGTKVVASNGVRTLKKTEEADSAEKPGVEEIDQHAWHDAANGAIYAANIQAALIALDPGNAATFRTRGATYRKQLLDLDVWAKQQIAGVPAAKRRVITSHDGFAYLGRAYGIQLIGVRGWTNDKEASAQRVAELIGQIKQEQVKALFIENMNDPRLIQRIAQETGVQVGGELYSDALSKPDEDGATYVQMVRHNITTLRAGMLKN